MVRRFKSDAQRKAVMGRLKDGRTAKIKTVKLRKPEIKDVKVGMVFKVKSKQFGVTNLAKVTSRPFFDVAGDRPNIFYAKFVGRKGMDDREFAVWSFNYAGSLSDSWERVK